MRTPELMGRAGGAVTGLFRRHPANPLLTAAQWPYRANAVFNPGAVRLASGETLLMVRVEDHRGISHLTAARSADGVGGWRIDPAPTFKPDPERFPEEIWGVEDPRIAYLEELGRYAMTYTAYSSDGPLVSLAVTDDFKTFDRVGPIMPPEDKDAALFPCRFHGRWALIHRPVPHISGAKANMWLSFSPDLRHWGDHKVLLKAREGGWWDGAKIGLSSQPIATPDGWLVVYHGVRDTPAGALYRVGLALLDGDDPRQVLRRGAGWVVGPEAPYEVAGGVPNVIFPCGAVFVEEHGELRLYYGAAGTCVGLLTAPLSDLLAWLRTQPVS